MEEKIIEQVNEKISNIIEEGINGNNLEALGKLVDIHKDIKNEKYWENKEANMRYMRDDYRDDYRGGRSRDSRGRYTERGISRYEGDDMIDDMKENYENYMESGRYNGPEKDKAFEYMLKSAEDFFCYLMEEVENPEQMGKIKRVARRISDM